MTSSKEIGDLADSFRLAARRSSEHRPKNDGTFEMLVIPSITSYCFSIELFLKALLNIGGNQQWGHKLFDLYQNLLSDSKASIITEVGMDEGAFCSELKTVSNAFVEWRYIYEKDKAQISLGFVAKLSDALEKVFVEKVG